MSGAWALAPAKVNLFLHVAPPRPDGMHPLVSLVAFADVGDRVRVSRAQNWSLSVTGPFADRIEGAPEDNLVMRALRRLTASFAPDAAFAVELDKRLPVAAGLGGGSSDAAAALRLAAAHLDLTPDDASVLDAARSIGADGPMCLAARSAWAEGLGDALTPEPRLPPLAALLINSGVPSPTGAVYRAYDTAPEGDVARPAPPSAWTTEAVIEWLGARRNDLERPAAALQPRIGEALDRANHLPGARLVRMSGSGATVFALFGSVVEANAAAETLADDRPKWWLTPCVLGADASNLQHSGRTTAVS